MATADLIHVGTDRFRVLPWQGDGGVAVVSPIPGEPPPSAASVLACIGQLSTRGIREVVTGALAQPEVASFLAAGFEVREHLYLLAHDLHRMPTPAQRIKLRRARPGDRTNVLAVDSAAFDDFWRLDADGLHDAVEATASTRFRVATRPGIVGYLITGRSGPRGYLQRLAVEPNLQGRGIGSALVIDGLRWLRRHGANQAVVNTQESNTGALAMYERLGFRRQPDGLSVLTRHTGPPS